MTTLSSINPASRPSIAPATVAQNAGSSAVSSGAANASAASQSAVVNVGNGNLQKVPDQTYSIPRVLAAASSAPVWKTSSSDAVSTLMSGNFLSHSLTNRMKGLGSALLDMLKNGTNNFSQSVSRPTDAKTVASASGQTTSYPWADDQLVIKTKNGVTVDISLNSQDDALSVQMKSSGELSDAERTALGNLSDAFQDAIDGLNAKPPRIDLAGLTQFDSTVLSSVDFHSKVTLDDQTPQTLDFHADSTTRTLNLDGPTGMMNVSIDMRDSSIWGSPKQQAAAVDSYLKQFDQAASRGNADKSLMAMFKDAFTQMNSAYAVSPQQPQQLQQRPAFTLVDADHAMLTGLADFNVSIGQIPKSPNPMHLSELDTFSYQASQSTTVQGKDQLNRSISQQQQSRLSASYHLSLIPDVRLELGTDNKSQNYYYKQIDDTANSSTEIGYTKGKLTKASSTQSASQSTHVLKYEMGKVTEDTTTPFNASLTRDILATLKPFLDDSRLDTPEDRYRWELTLANVHDQIFLQSNPADLHAGDWKAFVQADASQADASAADER